MALAGRCLLDALEYLRAIPKLPGRFAQLANAHTIRLVSRCLSDRHLNCPQVLEQLRPNIEEICRLLQVARQERPPHYGDDFWDWAAILEALVEVQPLCSDKVLNKITITGELEAFYEAVRSNLETGLTFQKEGEWYGPATATMTYRLLQRLRQELRERCTDIDETLGELRKEALKPIKNGRYRKRAVPSNLVLWHYGQVVAEFPNRDTKKQAARIADLSSVKRMTEKSERVYALARVIQGAYRLSAAAILKSATNELYTCQTPLRPLGAGVMADTVKGSLNVLEAIWPMLKSDDKIKIKAMVETLTNLHKKANTVGIVVAVDREWEAAKKTFESASARVHSSEDGTGFVDHSKYHAVVCMGKSLVGATDATRTLIDKHKVKWLIMFGIAGSLGTRLESDGTTSFSGPNKGHVVVATSIAPFRIRDKVRKEIENAKVPLRGDTWLAIPTDPTLFSLAHEAADELLAHRFHEGMIVTGTGIKDNLKIKGEVLKEFPGGLAVEEEGYVVALLCMLNRVPYLIIRGISDLAEGDKQEQGANPEIEAEEQAGAALAAAQVMVKVIELLCKHW